MRIVSDRTPRTHGACALAYIERKICSMRRGFCTLVLFILSGSSAVGSKVMCITIACGGGRAWENEASADHDWCFKPCVIVPNSVLRGAVGRVQSNNN